mgnify:CR=1 FL=1
MIYRLKEFKGDTIPVPQLVFSKLGIAEEYNVRVALYVLATGITDPDKICADLKLRSKMSAESALAFWAGAGLLERYEENAAPGEEPSAPAPMTWAEIAAASRTDPMISSLIDCAQAGFARPLTHREMEKLVNLYMQEGFAPETVMLCTAYVASTGRSTMAAVVHELKVWRTEGVETGEQADAHLKLLALRQSREQYVSGLLNIPESELTLGGRKAIARWYEVYGYDDAMVQEAAVQAGAKRDLWYWNSILKTWNAKGLRTVHDVRSPVAIAGASRNLRVDREAPSGNDFLKNFGDDMEKFRDAENLWDGPQFPMDAIDVNGRVALTIACSGIDARVARDVHKYSESPLLDGKGSYIYSLAVNFLFKGIGTHWTITLDDVTTEGDWSLVSVCNGRYYGGGFMPVAEARMDDGVLNTLVVREVNRRTFLKFVGPYSRGEYAKFPEYAHCSCPKVVHIHSEKPDIVTCLDGESVVNSDVTIKLHDKKLNFFGPEGCSCNRTARG